MISVRIATIIAIAAFAIGAFVMSPVPQAIAAVIATDVQCTGCVGTADLAGNAVTSVKIKDGEVKTDDIAAGAVGSLRIKDNDVKTQDIAPGAVTKAKLGADVLDTITTTRRIVTGIAVNPGASWYGQVACLTGEAMTGGGYSGYTLNNGLQFERSFPTSTNSWRVEAANPTSSTQYFDVYVVCAKLSP